METKMETRIALWAKVCQMSPGRFLILTPEDNENLSRLRARVNRYLKKKNSDWRIGFGVRVLSRTCRNHLVVEKWRRPIVVPRNGLVDQLGERADRNGAAIGLDQLEYQIVILAMHGHDNPEIASELNMTERTVKKYFSCMFEDFNIPTKISGRKVIKRIVLLSAIAKSLARIRNKDGFCPTVTTMRIRRLGEMFDQSSCNLRIIRLVAKGYKNEEIAVMTGDSVGVVKNKLREIFAIVGCESRTMLSQKFLEDQLMSRKVKSKRTPRQN